MRALFRACEARGVRYLLISGQATVLYGAAHFSQDFDLWIDPAPRNVRAFVSTLERLGARVHKLTPPLTQRNLRRGHGFHFVVPHGGYLDVMGRPPRVGGFGPARRASEPMNTPWGTIPVVSIPDLVELKKTNRPGDYEVITRLALIRLDREPGPPLSLVRWAARNIFGAEEAWAFVRQFGKALVRAPGGIPPAAAFLHRIWLQGREPTPDELSRAARMLGQMAIRLQDRGRRYWLPLIDELRRMRKAGLLLPAGMPVTGRLCV